MCRQKSYSTPNVQNTQWTSWKTLPEPVFFPLSEATRESKDEQRTRITFMVVGVRGGCDKLHLSVLEAM